MIRDERFYLNTYSDPAQRLIWEYALRNTTKLYPLARRDPIFTPIFTAIFGSITIGTTGISVAAVASAIATTALTIGLQAMLAPKPPTPEDGKAPLTQAIPYRIYGYGETRVAGVRALWEAKGSNLCIVQALCAHPIVEFTRFYFNDDIVEADPVTSKVSTVSSSDRYQKGGAWLYWREGSNPGIPYDKVITILGDDGVWTEDHRGDDQASLAIIAQNPRAQDMSQTFPYGAPAGSVVAKLRKVWDFRISDDPEDDEAWVFSKNSALILAHHWCLNPFGHRKDFTKAILPVLDMWIEEADICDEEVALNGGGTEKRYEFNIWDTTEHGPKTTTNAILASCDGWMCERGDQALLLTVGKFRESRCGVLSDADIAGYDFDEDVLFEDEINRIVPKFCYPATDYSTADTDFWEDTAAQLIAGKILSSEMDLRGVQQWRQARRLAKREFLRRRAKKAGALNLWACGINSIYKRWNRLGTPVLLPDMDGEIVENASSVLAIEKGGFSMKWRMHPGDLEDWNPATDEGQMPPVPPKPNAAGIVTPVINLVQAKPNGSSVYIRVDIIDPEDESIYPVVRYRVADDGSGSPGEWLEKEFPKVEPAGGYMKLNTDVVPSDKELEIEVAFIGSNRKYGDWTLAETIMSTVDTVAPLALASFTEVAGTHYGVAPFSITTKNDTHLSRAAIYRTVSGGAFNAATDLVEEIGVSPGTTFVYTVGDAPTMFTTNGDFALAGPPPTLGTGWTISAGKAAHSATSGGSISWSGLSLVVGDIVRFGLTIDSISGVSAALTPRLTGGTTVTGTALTTTGFKSGYLTAVTGNTTFAPLASTNAVIQIDDVKAFIQTANQEPAGTWDYRAAGLNVSGIAGPVSAPVTVTVI